MPARGAAGNGHPARAQQHGRLHAVSGSGTAQDTNEAREYREQQKPGETQIKCAHVVSLFYLIPYKLAIQRDTLARRPNAAWSALLEQV